MWVIPKNLNTSPSVQGTEGLTLGSKELSDLSEQSLLWRSSPSQSATWSQRWKKGLLRQHLYGRILKPSIGKSSVEEWISSQEASLASPFLPLDEDKQTPTPDTSSHTSSKDSKYANLPLFSLRMSKESSPQNSALKDGQTQKAHRFCSMYLESWRGWVMRRRQEYSQREKSVLHIEGNESSYLVLKEVPKEKAWSGSMDSLTETETQVALYTPPQEEETNTLGSPQEQTQENYKLNPRWVETLMGLPIGWVMPSCTSPLTIERMSSECLETELSLILQGEPSPTYGENWSTPPASQRGENLRHYISRMKSRLEQGKETFAPTLQVQAEAEERGVDIEESIWATPNTMDSLSLRSEEALRRQATTTRKGRTAPANLREQVDPKSCEIYASENKKSKGQVSLF